MCLPIVFLRPCLRFSKALAKAASLLGVGLELYSGHGVQPIAREDHHDRRNNNNHPSSQSQRQQPADGERATVRQLAAIHAASRKRGLGKDRLASYLVEHTGRTELSQLNRHEASSLIDSLNQGNGAAH